ncbi:MAG: DsbA family protein [Liquorilactobacillus hordei]|uniref:DsbA family protein n=1 Tax=Liquorilactobacillus hordei TaxID=468911 RepID=UPI0039EB4C03
MYLFINPVGRKSYQSEKNVIKLVNNLDTDIRFRFIPFLNLNTVTNVLSEHNLPLNNLDIRNKTFNNIYQASLDYKAALFQGKKYGRSFLLNLQNEIFNSNREYSNKVVHDIITSIGLDSEMFESDRHSKFTIESFKRDQQMAAEMNVTMHSTMVLYNLANIDFGVSLTDCSSYDMLEELCLGKLNDEIMLCKNSKVHKGSITSLHTL